MLFFLNYENEKKNPHFSLIHFTFWSFHLSGEKTFVFRMFFIRSFPLSGERSFVFLIFFKFIFSSFFSRDSFSFQKILKQFFLCYLAFKVMIPNNPLLNNSQNWQSWCPCVWNIYYYKVTWYIFTKSRITFRRQDHQIKSDQTRRAPGIETWSDS